MNEKPKSDARHVPALRNWLSLAGAIVASGGIFAFFVLFAIDLLGRASNPYMGILAYVVSPAFILLGLAMVAVGAWIQRRHVAAAGKPTAAHSLGIDLSRPADR